MTNRFQEAYRRKLISVINEIMVTEGQVADEILAVSQTKIALRLSWGPEAGVGRRRFFRKRTA